METAAAPLERPKSLTALAQERLRTMIVAGEFALGEQLSEAALAARLGISKTPVREALLRLKTEGLIEIQPQRGTFVFALTQEQVDEICRFREILEVAALAEAMAPARRTQLVKDLAANVQKMAAAHAAGDYRALPWLDQEFHEIILASSGNPYLREAYELVAWQIRALRARLPERNDRVAHCRDNHAAIVRIVRAGSTAKAQRALAAHIRDTRAAYIEASRQPVPPRASA